MMDPACLQVSQGPMQRGLSIYRSCLSAHVLSLGYDTFQVSQAYELVGGKIPKLKYYDYPSPSPSPFFNQSRKAYAFAISQFVHWS